MEPSEQDETEKPPRSEVAKREYRRPEIDELGDVPDMLNGRDREMLGSK